MKQYAIFIGPVQQHTSDMGLTPIDSCQLKYRIAFRKSMISVLFMPGSFINGPEYLFWVICLQKTLGLATKGRRINFACPQQWLPMG
jgi:hypothetical protein